MKLEERKETGSAHFDDEFKNVRIRDHNGRSTQDRGCAGCRKKQEVG